MNLETIITAMFTGVGVGVIVFLIFVWVVAQRIRIRIDSDLESTMEKLAHDPNSNINKSLRRWHCESIEQMQELVMLAEQFIRNHKK